MSASSSNSSEEGGNIKPPLNEKKKQISPSKRWCLTLNNYTEVEVSAIVPLLRETCAVYCVGYEVGASGTPHLQGYLEFKTKRRPKSVFSFTDRIIWAKANGSKEDNYNYICDNCEKKDVNLLCINGFKKKPTTIQRKDFYLWQEKIVKIIEVPCEWDCRKIYWYYGEAGLGKTQFCKWCCVHLNAIIIGGSSKHMLAQVQNQEAPIYIVLLSYGDEMVAYRALEQIKDGLFSSAFGCDNNKMEIRDAPHLIVIGNEPPDMDDRNFHPGKYKVHKIENTVV